jgi:hypothetical protein
MKANMNRQSVYLVYTVIAAGVALQLLAVLAFVTAR